MGRIYTSEYATQTNGFHIGNTIIKVSTSKFTPHENGFRNQIAAAHSAELLPYLSTVFLQKNDLIYSYGEDITYIYFPENAVISENQILEDGRTLEVAMIGKEGLSGLEVIMNSGRASHWAHVSVEGNALKMSAEIFKNKFDRNADFRERILSYLHVYYKQTAQKIICNCYHLIENRLCSWILMLNSRTAKSSFPITQEQLACYLGVHRPSITLIMQELRKRKILTYKRGQIRINNREELENAACDCFISTDKNFAGRN